MEQEPQRTDISRLGEFGLIERLAKNVEIFHPQTQMGIGDDAAVYALGEQLLLHSTDMLLEGVHFDLAYTPLPHLGYKAIAVNVSDIAAMNGLPLQVTVGLGLSNRFSVEAVEALYEGIRAACKNYKVDLVGGDTTSSRSGLVISVNILGTCQADQVSYRHTAGEGDILCCSGDLGAAYIGLQLLEREKQTFLANPDMQPDLAQKAYLVSRQLKPEARTDIVHDLRELGIVPTAMIDISDGLASEIHHLCHRSGLGAYIYEDKVPIDKESYEVALNDFNISPITCALNGGEDYELLFTIRQEDYEKIKNHADISTIGYMTAPDKGIRLITRGGQSVAIQAQGWQHFQSKPSQG
jgi:thiamine-monophosphate kinase